MTVAITTTTQDVYPPRVQVSLTGLTLGDNVVLYRQVAGVRTAIRGGTSEGVTDTAFVVVDAELPFGTPVTYVANVNGTAEYTAGPTTYTLTGGKVALSDAISGASAEVVISGFGDLTRNRDSARFRVAGRNIVVSGPLGQREGSYELLTETTTAYENLMSLLETATEGTVQIRQPGVSEVTGDPYDGIDAYLAVDSITERRVSQDGSDPRRFVTIEFAETDGWATTLEARGFTLGDIANYLGTSATLSDLATFVGSTGTLLDIAQTDWGV